MSLVFDYDAPHDPAATELAAVLGGKGAELHLMAVELGLPVPPAFTISTRACREYLASGWPDRLDAELRQHMARLEERVGRRFGDADDPLLVSVRSGAPISMPGMMDTILDLGLNDATTRGLATASGDPDFAADCRRRFEEMYRGIVGVDEVPDDPWEQLRAAIEAVFRSWNAPRAVAYRSREGIPDDLGTAVTVQAMVFGNRDATSGSGVLFTRDPATGARTPYGDVMFAAQGEDVVAGTHHTAGLAELAERLPAVTSQLQRHAEALELHHADMCDIEFTIEQGRLWLLQCRIGKRSPQAALRMAVEMADDPDFPLTRAQALERVAPILADPPRPIARPAADAVALATGLPASPGLASGEIVTSADAAVRVAETGRPVILVRTETSPDDVHGMSRAAGLLTSRGGLASHAAVVARGWGIPAVVGATDLEVGDGEIRLAGRVLSAGSQLTVDGSGGRIFEGAVAAEEQEMAELAVLRGWADELRMQAGPPGGSTNASPSPAAEAPTLDPASLLPILAVKGFGTAEGLAEAVAVAPSAVEAAVARLASDGLVETVAGSYRLSADGRAAAEAEMAADRERWGSERAGSALEAFAMLDGRVKEVVTAWQLRPEGSASQDDRRIVDQLRAVHDDALAFLAPHAEALGRLQLYATRLQRAVDRLDAGDGRYVASPRVDSYHSVWFELHEELILLCGRTRADEVAAGRA